MGGAVDGLGARCICSYTAGVSGCRLPTLDWEPVQLSALFWISADHGVDAERPGVEGAAPSASA